MTRKRDEISFLEDHPQTTNRFRVHPQQDSPTCYNVSPVEYALIIRARTHHRKSWSEATPCARFSGQEQ